MRRVAITGAGVVSPLGNTLEDFYQSLRAARSGIRLLPDDVAQGSDVTRWVLELLRVDLGELSGELVSVIAVARQESLFAGDAP